MKENNKINDVTKNAAKQVGNTLGGPVGGMLASKLAQNKLGRNKLNSANNPFNRIHHKGQFHQPEPINENPSELEDNSSFDGSSSKKGETFNNGFSSSFEREDETPKEGKVKGTIKPKTKIKIVAIILISSISLFFSIAIIGIIVTNTMAPIMTVRDSITKLSQQFTTGIEKFINFAQGDGWMTNEDSFFTYLDEQYEKFRYTTSSGSELDIPLVAATIHYSKMIDLDQYEESIGIPEEGYGDEDFEQLGTFLSKDQTVSFYDVAKDKLGSVNTIWPGQKRLLGHIVKTEITVVDLPIGEALGYWNEFLQYMGQSLLETSDDVLKTMTSFVTVYGDAISYNNITGDALAGVKYDYANVVYEYQEFFHNFSELYSRITGQAQTTIDENGNTVPLVDENGNLVSDNSEGWLKVPTPIIKRPMHYGYDEYKEMKVQMLKMRATLRSEGFSFDTDDDVLSLAENSSNSELKEIYSKYKDLESKYLYSYTHYLQNVYVPFTYFYNQEYTQEDVDNIIDEIYDQRDFYNYLIGDKSYLIQGCGYTYTGDAIDVSIDTSMLENIYVNVLHYEEMSRKSTNIAETVSLKDYVTGVLYREVGASVNDNPEYLKANIIAIKSYTVGRPSVMGDKIVNENGKYYITMRNNTADQVYCSVTKGCMDAPENRKEAPSAELVAYIGNLYDEVSDKFLYDSNADNFTGSYRDKVSTCANAGIVGECLGQRESKELGEQGNNWEHILATFYENSIGIVDVSTSKLTTSVMSCISPGLQLGTGGYSVRVAAPTINDQYFKYPYVGNNIGQCVWYVKGRATEIIANSLADPEKKRVAMETIKTMYGNGNQWYAEHLTSVFGSSTDYTQPRAGAIAVYTWPSPDENGNNYGHSVIVEKVEGDQVYVSQGWNGCGGAYGGSTWDCVRFDYSPYTIEQMKNLNKPSKYKFIGYVYLLD